MSKHFLFCRSIDYRQGAIEVIPGIHPNCINVEVWTTSEMTAEGREIGRADLSDAKVNANCEIELSIPEAEALISILTKAIAEINSIPT